MAEITLRAYVKEIDDLIEREKLDEAIAHCRHILQLYPKHLETYRLLGKAYLEAKRFGDAADIFQRVLSAVPDDFVSHVGMAIVREDEGNLDAAIWHMERAFETNPANPAIRQELSRLIGRRDGLEPHKVRLTRGALARQYAQGELFPQAISELRSALQEDPDRPDLEVLLAIMYWRGGQLKEAKKICEQILEKLPFSVEANRIMADLSDQKGDEQKAGEYHRKLASLDPYFGFLESVEMDPASVDAGAVRVDHSTWSPGEPLPQAEEGPPAWVTSLGVDLSEGDTDAISPTPQPAWLSDLDASPGERARASSLNEPALSGSDLNSEIESEDAIPDWMREAGWGPSSGEAAEEAPVSFSDAELEALDSGMEPIIPPAEGNGELEPAEIPSWMRSIAPREEPPADAKPEKTPSAEESMDDGVVPDWLSEIASEDDTAAGETEVPAQEPEPEFEPASDTDEELSPETEAGAGVPTWIDTQSPGATSTIIAWLGDREGDVSDEEKAVDELAAAFGAGGEGQLEDFPSWLEETGELSSDELEEPQPAGAGGPEGPPSWLAGVAEAASQQGTARAPKEEEPAAEATPSYRGVDTGGDTENWVRTLAEQEETAAVTPPTPGGSDWLTGLGDEDESGAESADVPPDWLASDAAEEDEMIASRLSSAAQTPDWLDGVEEVSPDTLPESGDVPDWLMGIAEGKSSRPAGTAAGIEPPGAGESGAPDWLSEFSTEDTEAEPAGEPEFDPQALQEFEAEISLEAEPGIAGPDLDQSGALSEDLDDEEVFKWLESLAEGQETGDAGAISEPVQGASEASPAASEPGIREEAPPDEPAESLRWLEDLASQRGIDVDIEASTFQASIQPTPVESQPIEPAAMPAEEIPADAMTDEPVEQEPVGEESPDWLIEMATQDSDETVIARRSPEMIKAEEAPPAIFSEEPEQVAQTPPEPAAAEIPGWLDEAAAVAQEVPAEPPRTTGRPPQQASIESTLPASSQPSVEGEPSAPAPEKAAPPAAEKPAPPPVVQAAAKEEAPPATKQEQAVKASVPAATESIPAAPPVEKTETAQGVEQAEPARPRYKEPATDAQQLLKSARGALAAGDAGRALSDYKKLIERKQDLETVISDLKRALDRYPNLPTLWQALGDAYMKADRLNDAIKAYQRGMEVA